MPSLRQDRKMKDTYKKKKKKRQAPRQFLENNPKLAN